MSSEGNVGLQKVPDLREPQGMDGTEIAGGASSDNGPTVEYHENVDLPATPRQRSESRTDRSRSPKSQKIKRRRSPRSPSHVDPTSIPAIYSNLIVAEDSFRTQYLELQTYRRKNILFFWATTLGAAYLSYVNVYQPSVYRWVRLLQHLLAITAYISLVLFYLTGLYSKVFFFAPRFVSDANKGMRAFNVRLVRTHSSWKEHLFRLFDPSYMEHPGGIVKLVLSPRAFSPHFIEAWEVYRQGFWERQRRKSRSTLRPSARPRKQSKPPKRCDSSSTPVH